MGKLSGVEILMHIVLCEGFGMTAMGVWLKSLLKEMNYFV